ncbi:hypothetical protein ACFL9U_00355 [Thermodesulfobacteriota bacterium]
MKERLRQIGKLIPIENTKNDGPAERYKFEGADGEVGFISALSHHFCKKCNRLRLTASGHLRACLLSDRQIDAKGPMRTGLKDSELADLFLKAVKSKPFEHEIGVHKPDRIAGQMCAIGG